MVERYLPAPEPPFDRRKWEAKKVRAAEKAAIDKTHARGHDIINEFKGKIAQGRGRSFNEDLEAEQMAKAMELYNAKPVSEWIEPIKKGDKK
ncbi:MAG: hypothetical protein WCT37_05280 [Patescibacteria group bacterium]|jgi:hypothetical protein